MHRIPLFLAVAAVAVQPLVAQERVDWNARAAEHLINRAGFGATPEEVERAVDLGLEAYVDELFRGDDHIHEPYYTRVRRRGALRDRLADMESSEMGAVDMELDDESRRDLAREIRRDDYDQLRDFLSWWVERMIEGDDPLRERMTLFWHGHFTSSMDDVKNSHEMIVQNQLFRTHGLGSFRQLVHEIARDPAMLEYLDNDANRSKKPNENFARELMELFTLGEGHYTEDDVKEAARAFTGWTDDDGRFRFSRRDHDYKQKTVLGVTGLLDGDDVIDVLIDSEHCAPFLARKLLVWFEGAEPSDERVERYAEVLCEADFEVAPLLRALFIDPAFYRDEVLGARIAGPIDFLVGTARRLDMEPPPALVLLGSSMLGQRLLFPPNVKGWEGGRAWITTGTLMQRGNLAGVLLGEVSMDDFLDYDPLEDPTLNPFGDSMEAASAGEMGAMDEMGEVVASDEVDADAEQNARREERERERRALGELRGLRRFDHVGRRINLTAVVRDARAESDAEVVEVLCERLLAIEADAATKASLVEVLRADREASGLAEGGSSQRTWASEPMLRRFAHVVLSLPEAQLH